MYTWQWKWLLGPYPELLYTGPDHICHTWQWISPLAMNVTTGSECEHWPWMWHIGSKFYQWPLMLHLAMNFITDNDDSNLIFIKWFLVFPTSKQIALKKPISIRPTRSPALVHPDVSLGASRIPVLYTELVKKPRDPFEKSQSITPEFLFLHPSHNHLNVTETLLMGR